MKATLTSSCRILKQRCVDIGRWKVDVSHHTSSNEDVLDRALFAHLISLDPANVPPIMLPFPVAMFACHWSCRLLFSIVPIS